MSFGILSVVGMVLFLYLVWRNLKENYQEELLISYSWVALVFFWVGGRVWYGLENWGIWNESWMNWFNILGYPGLNFVGGYLGFLVVSYLVCKNNSWKFWPFLEDIGGNIGILVLFLMLNDLVSLKFNLSLVLEAAAIVVSLVLFEILKGKYRSFVWYRSGKKGFVFFAVNFIFWLLLGILSFVFKLGQVQAYLSLAVGLISLLGLFILGEVIPLLVFEKGKK